jgi:hypothetical protein
MGQRRPRRSKGAFRYATGQTVRAGTVALSAYNYKKSSSPYMKSLSAGVGASVAQDMARARTARRTSKASVPRHTGQRLSAAQRNQRRQAARAPRRRRARR